jgi:hypothetical protein
MGETAIVVEDRELERLLADDLAVLLSESFASAASGAAATAGGDESRGEALPGSRTLSFLFTDIEGSTAMLRRLGGAYAGVLADHRRLIREALAAHGGREMDTQGDALFAVFGTAGACAVSAIAIQQAMAAHSWPGGERLRVRIGMHAGEAEQTQTGLVGIEVHRRGHRNWPGEVSVSLFHTTATTSPGSITAHPVWRSRRTRPSGRTSTPVSFLFSAVANRTWPILVTTMEMDPGLPMRGMSRSRIVSPVIDHRLQLSAAADRTGLRLVALPVVQMPHMFRSRDR